jgi:galactose mutarotase-like enzyme
MTLPTPTPLETVVLKSGTASVYLAPSRGGMATRFFVGERPIFYLDEATLLDTSKNVRGGNPVLFPSPGRLENDTFKTRDGKTGKMSQHGFGRTSSWDVVAKSENELTLRLVSNEKTRAVFPWDFVATYRYTLDGPTLRIAQRIETTSPSVPVAVGFHPYFQLADKDKGKARIPTESTRAWDNVAKKIVTLAPSKVAGCPIDLTQPEVDIHLLDHEATMAVLELGDGHHIEVRASRHFQHWVVWTLAGKDFVCLEPWSAPGNALNTGEEILNAEPNKPLHLWTEIAFI